MCFIWNKTKNMWIIFVLNSKRQSASDLYSGFLLNGSCIGCLSLFRLFELKRQSSRFFFFFLCHLINSCYFFFFLYKYFYLLFSSWWRCLLAHLTVTKTLNIFEIKILSLTKICLVRYQFNSYTCHVFCSLSSTKHRYK